MASDAQALARALRDLADKAEGAAGRAAVRAMGREGKQEIQRQLSLRAHPPGTPSPSPAGQPPARITGGLSRSVVVTMPRQSGPARWEVRSGATAVQARIQERGGRTGRNHATTLPPRPYHLPAAVLLITSGRARDAAVTAFRRETGI
jgi:hypothetical protein